MVSFQDNLSDLLTLITDHWPLIQNDFHHHLHNRRRSFAVHLHPDCETGDSLDDQDNHRRRNPVGAVGCRRLLVVEQSAHS